jgi:hypothetical protein
MGGDPLRPAPDTAVVVTLDVVAEGAAVLAALAALDRDDSPGGGEDIPSLGPRLRAQLLDVLDGARGEAGGGEAQNLAARASRSAPDERGRGK